MIKQTRYGRALAWVMENEIVRVVIVPEYGGKIVSLYDRRAGFEWLVQAQGAHKPEGYGSIFIEGDMCGWDEMFPTINACRYPIEGAFFNRALPDHGEVWSLPWSAAASAGASGSQFSLLNPRKPEKLVFSVEGRALPYRFWRAAWFPNPDCLQLDYALVNLAAEPIHCLWAAHPQFAAKQGTRIVLPETVDEVVNVVSGGAWGEEGIRVSWPRAKSAAGTNWQLDQIRPAEAHDCRKFYLPPDKPVSWAGLMQPDCKCSLRLSWQTEEIPYLGIWVDEGAYNPQPTVALEPSNGYYDSLATAVSLGRALILQPAEKRHWSLRLNLISENS